MRSHRRRKHRNAARPVEPRGVRGTPSTVPPNGEGGEFPWGVKGGHGPFQKEGAGAGDPGARVHRDGGACCCHQTLELRPQTPASEQSDHMRGEGDHHGTSPGDGELVVYPGAETPLHRARRAHPPWSEPPWRGSRSDRLGAASPTSPCIWRGLPVTPTGERAHRTPPPRVGKECRSR